MTNQQLMEVFNFTLEDIAQNRQRIISRRQINNLKRIRLEACVLPIFMTILAGGFALSSIPRESRQILTFIVAASISLFFAFIGLRRWIQLSKDLSMGKVSNIHGKVSIGTAQTRNIGYQAEGCRLKVNASEFIIPFDARSSFSEGVRYSIFYLPTSNIVLSVEKDGMSRSR